MRSVLTSRAWGVPDARLHAVIAVSDVLAAPLEDVTVQRIVNGDHEVSGAIQTLREHWQAHAHARTRPTLQSRCPARERAERLCVSVAGHSGAMFD